MRSDMEVRMVRRMVCGALCALGAAMSNVGCNATAALDNAGSGADASMAPGDVDAAVVPDLAEEGGSITLTMDSFQVEPGTEAYRCQNFANPFGEDFDVKRWESHMTPGSHHLLVFYKTGATSTPIETCSGLEFSSMAYGAQTPDADIA